MLFSYGAPFGAVFFRNMYKLKSHQDLSHGPARFNAAGGPSHVVGRAVDLAAIHIKRACPRAVKIFILTMDLTGEQEGGNAFPKLVEALLTRDKVGVGKAEGQPVVGIDRRCLRGGRTLPYDCGRKRRGSRCPIPRSLRTDGGISQDRR